MELHRKKIGNKVLDPPIMNGAGCIKTIDHAIEMVKAPVGAIVIGSITKNPRDGNSGNVWDGENLNALGLPNPGETFLRSCLRPITQMAHDQGKYVIVNIVGETPEEFAEIAATAFHNGADIIELNTACPNNRSEQGMWAPMFCYDLELLDQTLKACRKEIGALANVWVKVSYYPDRSQMHETALLLCEHQLVKGIVVANTFPDGLKFKENGKPILDVKFGGYSGRNILPAAVGQVNRWHELLKRLSVRDRISLIGIGGIEDGEGLRQHYFAGADAFQATTAVLKNGSFNPHVFERILVEFSQLEEEETTA